jgi:hypothetical protein
MPGGLQPLSDVRGSDRSRERQRVPMALRAAKGNEAALGRRGARAHACRLDTRVEAWLLRLTNRVFNGEDFCPRRLPQSLDHHLA